MNTEFFDKIVSYFEKNAARFYLIVANLVLVVFAIWFSNVGILPFQSMSDFIFFITLALLLGIYRPSWMFAFFVGTLALENINIAPSSIGLALRPYQLFGFIVIVSIFIQYLSKRLNFSLPKWRWYDILPVTFALGGMLSSFAATNHGATFKQSIVALSFVSLYYLTRVYIQSFEDLKKIAPFFLSSGLIVSIYGIWQNARFIVGNNPFETMPGRPNATFTEPDWFGAYLVFLLSIILTVIYFKIKKNKSLDLGFAINYAILIPIVVALILTVSRSAWLGAALVIIGFLKIVLTNGRIKISAWKWNDCALHSFAVAVTVLISLLISTQLTNFQIFKRAQSTGGLQNITVACQQETSLNTQSIIGNINELESYGCKFINLEEIEKEKAQGLNVFEIKRPDPTVGIRAQIYTKSIQQIKSHPVFGIGWGSISDILGKDENGNGLNASNIFLETWLGSGLIGFLSLVILLGFILVKSSIQYLNKKITDKTAVSLVALGWFAIVIPNLFNSGIFLGFVWVYLAVAVSLLNEKKYA